MKDFFKMFDFVKENEEKESATSALSEKPTSEAVEDVVEEIEEEANN